MQKAWLDATQDCEKNITKSSSKALSPVIRLLPVVAEIHVKLRVLL